MAVRSARPPARWPAVQQAFEAAFEADHETYDHTPVLISWWTVRNDRSGGKLRRIGRGIYGSLTKGTAASWFDGTYVAIFPSPARRGQPPELILEVAADALPEPEGYGEAVLVGEYLQNGACALDLDDLGIVFPKSPPFVQRAGAPPPPVRAEQLSDDERRELLDGETDE